MLAPRPLPCGSMALRALVSVLGLAMAADALAFHPKDPLDDLWDTWIYRMPDGQWLLNYLVKHHVQRWQVRQDSGGSLR